MKSATNQNHPTSKQSLIRPIHCGTASGQKASYGKDRGTVWLAFSHCKNRSSVIYATPNWKGGLARLREIICRHGILIQPQHHAMFGIEAEEIALEMQEREGTPGKFRNKTRNRIVRPTPKKTTSPIQRTLRMLAGRPHPTPAHA